MANAYLDENSVPTLTGVLNTDGTTITRIVVNPANHALKVDDDTTGTDYGPDYALRDENNRPVLIATSSADGVTPVAVYADSTGKLLIDSN